MSSLSSFLMIVIIPCSTRCRVFPSQYSFRDDDVFRCENDTNVCTNYDENADPILTNIDTSQFVMCGGDIRLSDSDYGPQQYSDSDQDRFYIWKRADNSRLLFTFPSTVQLTYITLHYYSDSCASLPTIGLQQVDSEWKIWRNIPGSGSLSGIDSTQPMEPGSLKSVTHIITGFNSIQLLMVISTFSGQNQSFFLSEVEFFDESTIRETPTTQNPPSTGSSNSTMRTTCNVNLDKSGTTTETTSTTTPTTQNDASTTETPPEIMTSTVVTDNNVSQDETTIDASIIDDSLDARDSSDNNDVIIAVVTTIGLLVLIVVALVIIGIIILLLRRKKRKEKEHSATDPKQTVDSCQKKPIDITDNGSKDTGCDIVGTDNELEPPSSVENKHTVESQQSKYVDVEPKKTNTDDVVPERTNSDNVVPEKTNIDVVVLEKTNSDNVVPEKTHSDDVVPEKTNSDDLVTTETDYDDVVLKDNVDKNDPDSNIKTDIDQTPNSGAMADNPNEVSGMYSVIQREYMANEGEKEHDESTEDKDANPIPDDEMYSVVKNNDEKGALATDEDAMYSTVQKNHKQSNAEDEDEDAPPIPPHTVEEMYTAVQKNPKKVDDHTTIDSEDDAPPIPPHTEEDMYTVVEK